MGSYAFTCAVSGLPIECGDPVRYLLLTENPYERAGGTNGLWFPRTFPICAKYNDYGSVEYEQTGPLRDVWLEGLQKDLVESGWGDNSCHDVPVKKSMSFDELLTAIVEQRVHVRRAVSFEASYGFEETLRARFRNRTPKGIPTRKRVEAALAASGFLLYAGMSGRNGMMINKKDYGTIRVRFQGYGEDYEKEEEWLRKAQAIFGDYATMISAGTGPYANKAELLIRPKPGTKDYHGSRKEKPQKSLRVDHAMIREDVWRELLKSKVETWDGSPAEIQNYRAGIRAAYKEYLGRKDKPSFLDTSVLVDKLSTKYTGAWIARNAFPYTIGLGTHWNMLVAHAPLEDNVLDTIAEFALIYDALSMIRYWWHPSYAIGPQFGEWDKHVAFHKAMAGIAARQNK